MKISGQAILSSSPDQVFDAFHDPAVLTRTLPGCEQLTEVAPNSYAMTITAGVAAIKGTYDGTVALENPQRPHSFTMKAAGAGGPGTVSADVRVFLAEATDGGTNLTYEADAVVGGVIGGVGQRMLGGVTKKMAGQFFKAVDRDIAGERPAIREPVAVGVPGGGPTIRDRQVTADGAAVAPTVGGTAPVFAGHRVMTSPGGRDLAVGALIGGLLVLAGVIIGGVIGRR